ncbi:hypothetical protein [Flavobacterium sp. GT3R68]|uniref:hypothetical protein n=1 Tax=Flavobacterium sp. GT3R68 TaxID=2594437 RepID=UPI000F893671|nr:hypothetical protein [Flavobacterium sp. GT3R68]RTY90897.1 hypothetical protein EKL32_19745 [Flavobacterium sp. GSN2]TRW90460.1 hypothetical protein FNW07_10525 [Flavobacterium sp. GT3R68]
MESNNIENQIKQKLESRRIQPSAQAWDRLDAMLSVAEEKQIKSSHNWLYVAAGILGFILIGSVFLSQTEEVIDIPKNEIVLENNTIENLQQPNVNGNPAEIIRPLNTEAVMRTARRTQNMQKQQTKPNTMIVPFENKNNVAINIVAPKENAVEEEKTIAVTPVMKKETLPEKPTIKVDASSLLSQVDGELELSFREKVITTAGKNFQTIKVALASRNNNE